MPVAVAYYRVSSEKQVREGHGLDSQKMRCHAFARANGYTIIADFQDEGVSGGVFKRPALMEMFAFLDEHPEVEVCIYDELGRTARGSEIHGQIKAHLRQRGVKPLYVNRNYEDTPSGHLMENIEVAMKQYEREDNRERVVNRMRDRFRNGFWLFFPYYGYEFYNSSLGKNIRPKEPQATIVREALEGFASGRFPRLEDVRHFVERQEHQHAPAGKRFRKQQAHRLLSRARFYAGYMSVPNWPDIGEVHGKYEPLISAEVADTIAYKRNESRTWVVRRVRPDFPLKRHVRCAVCGRPLTAALSTGRSGERFPYYRCYNSACPTGSIRKDVLEYAFVEVMKRMMPKPGQVRLFLQQVRGKWSDREHLYDGKVNLLENEICRLDESITNMVRAVATSRDSGVQSLYEAEIRKLTAEKCSIQAKINNAQKMGVAAQVGTALEVAEKYLPNSLSIWKSGNMDQRTLLLKLLFSNGLQYDRKNGLGTVPNPLSDALYEVSGNTYCKMVEQVGQNWKQFIAHLEDIIQSEELRQLLCNVEECPDTSS